VNKFFKFPLIMSSEKYEMSQDELELLLDKLGTGLDQLENSSGEARKRFLQVCRGQLDEANKLTDEMETEARGAPLQYRAEMLASVRQFQEQVRNKQAIFTKRSYSKRDVFSNQVEENSGGANKEYRQQVLAGSRVLERTGDSLIRTQQIAVETEAVGGEIIGDLGTQREALERARTRLIDTDEELGRSRKIIRKMYLNVFSNKILLVCIILVEAGILAAIVYWKYFKKK